MLAVLFGILGLIVGSFLNVLVLRRSLKSLGGRSACMSCGSQIAWYDNIPVISWFILGGRCRTCGSRISFQYPLVEAVTGILFALLGYQGLSVVLTEGVLVLLIYAVIIALLVAIATYDIKHTIIPNAWVWTFNALALATALTTLDISSSVLHTLIAGPVAALPLFALWLVSKGRWMGFGDVKLALGIGWLLGLANGFFAVVLAFVIGALVSVGILLPLPYLSTLLQKWGIVRFRASYTRLTMKSEVPFGPFLIASCVLVWFALLYSVPQFISWISLYNF